MTTEDKEEITNDDEYNLYFVEQQNGPRRRVEHGDVTLHGVLEKVAPDGHVIDKTGLGRIDVAALAFDSVSDRDEFWKISDLYINLFDMPTEAAELIREYLSQVVKPVTESEMIFHYCGVSTWVE
jgi:hypothetical protein